MMNKTLWRYAVLSAFFLLFICNQEVVGQEKGSWNRKTADEWFSKMEWLNGKESLPKPRKFDAFGREITDLPEDGEEAPQSANHSRHLTPHAAIDKLKFAVQYHANQQWWDEAFAFLKNTDLAAIKPGKYAIDGDNVVATVYEGPSRLPDTTKWELHHHFEDIHYIFSGKEQIGIASVSLAKLIGAYDEARDIAYYQAKGDYYPLPEGTFLIVFTDDVHRPGLKMKNQDTVKRIVIKVRKAE